MINNGTIDDNQDLYFVGMVLTYTCNSGFATRSEVETVCRNIGGNFVWSLDNNLPNCLGSRFSFSSDKKN